MLKRQATSAHAGPKGLTLGDQEAQVELRDAGAVLKRTSLIDASIFASLVSNSSETTTTPPLAPPTTLTPLVASARAVVRGRFLLVYLEALLLVGPALERAMACARGAGSFISLPLERVWRHSICRPMRLSYALQHRGAP